MRSKIQKQYFVHKQLYAITGAVVFLGGLYFLFTAFYNLYAQPSSYKDFYNYSHFLVAGLAFTIYVLALKKIIPDFYSIIAASVPVLFFLIKLVLIDS